ncbi:MAG: SGNH/GDSL hydrolase family protein [Nanoarchaeota archaeon]|nr:SGNH/GDSL hydrolase family protein [Nanoarchaeota archaeon]
MDKFPAKRLLVPAVIFFLVLASAELSVMLIAPQRLYNRYNSVHPDYRPPTEPHCYLGWYNRPSSETISYDLDSGLYTARHNAVGFRGPEVYNTTVSRALAFGDSQTYGLYLSEAETIPRRLQGLTGVETLNLGVIGYSTDQELVLYESLKGNLEHDIVIVFFYINDLNGNIQRMQHGLQKPYYALRNGSLVLKKADICELPEQRDHTYFGLDRIFRSWSHLYTWAVNVRQDREQIHFYDVFDQIAYYLMRQEGRYYRPSLDLTLAILERFRDEVEADGGCFILVNLPVKLIVLEDYRPGYFDGYLDRTEDDFDFYRIDHELEAFAQDRGMTFVNTNILVSADPRRHAYFVDDDAHLSAEGAGKVAELVAPYVRECSEPRNI